jgi:hypothetical protein
MPVHYKNATVAHQPKTAIGVRSFGPHFSRLTGREYMGYSPSKKSVQRIRQKVAEHLAPNNVAPWEEKAAQGSVAGHPASSPGRPSPGNWDCSGCRAGQVTPVRESAMKPVGKPDAGKQHVRFDERGWETGRRYSSAPAPSLDSTLPPGFCPARNFTSVRPSADRVYRGVVTPNLTPARFNVTQPFRRPPPPAAPIP